MNGRNKPVQQDMEESQQQQQQKQEKRRSRRFSNFLKKLGTKRGKSRKALIAENTSQTQEHSLITQSSSQAVQSLQNDVFQKHSSTFSQENSMEQPLTQLTTNKSYNRSRKSMQRVTPFISQGKQLSSQVSKKSEDRLEPLKHSLKNTDKSHSKELVVQDATTNQIQTKQKQISKTKQQKPLYQKSLLKQLSNQLDPLHPQNLSRIGDPNIPSEDQFRKPMDPEMLKCPYRFQGYENYDVSVMESKDHPLDDYFLGGGYLQAGSGNNQEYQFIRDNVFIAKLPKLEVFSFYVQPMCLLESNTSTEKKSTKIIAKGFLLDSSELLKKAQLQDRFTMKFELTFFWDKQVAQEEVASSSKKKQKKMEVKRHPLIDQDKCQQKYINGDIKLDAWVEVPPLFQMSPRSVVQAAGDFALKQFIPRLLRQRIESQYDDYAVWQSKQFQTLKEGKILEERDESNLTLSVDKDKYQDASSNTQNSAMQSFVNNSADLTFQAQQQPVVPEGDEEFDDVVNEQISSHGRHNNQSLHSQLSASTFYSANSDALSRTVSKQGSMDVQGLGESLDQFKLSQNGSYSMDLNSEQKKQSVESQFQRESNDQFKDAWNKQLEIAMQSKLYQKVA